MKSGLASKRINKHSYASQRMLLWLGCFRMRCGTMLKNVDKCKLNALAVNAPAENSKKCVTCTLILQNACDAAHVV